MEQITTVCFACSYTDPFFLSSHVTRLVSSSISCETKCGKLFREFASCLSSRRLRPFPLPILPGDVITPFKPSLDPISEIKFDSLAFPVRGNTVTLYRVVQIFHFVCPFYVHFGYPISEEFTSNLGLGPIYAALVSVTMLTDLAKQKLLDSRPCWWGFRRGVQ
jgi:hypothetical protein